MQFRERTFILGSRICYLGPRKGSQLEGTLALPTNAKELLTGTSALEWHHIAGLLEASYQAHNL